MTRNLGSNFLALRRLTGPLSDTEEALLEALYRCMPEGLAYKRTSRGRFAPLDAVLASAIDARFPARPVSVHDMAASSAITSLELYRLLSSSRSVTMRASDYYDAVYIVSARGSLWRLVFDVEDHPIQFICQIFEVS